jgi:hypothetical protein
MQLLQPLFMIGSCLALLLVPNTWHHLHDEKETTLERLVHQDVSDLSEHCLSWIRVSCTLSYRGPWRAWWPCDHSVHTLPLLFIDIEDVTFNVTQVEVAGSPWTMQLCQRPPQMFPNVVDVDGMEVHAQGRESVACSVDAHARQCQSDRVVRTQSLA